MSGKIRRQKDPLLWCVIMGVSESNTDYEKLLKCAFELDSISNFLCDPMKMNEKDLLKWKSSIFEFGKSFAPVFFVEISTKLYRAMRHVKDHVLDLGCLSRGSSEEKEELHKHFKSRVQNTNRNIDLMASQLLNVLVQRHNFSGLTATEDFDCESEDEIECPVEENNSQFEMWTYLMSDAISTVHIKSGHFTSAQVTEAVLT